MIEDHAGVDPGQLALSIQIEDAVQVLRMVDDHRDVAALPGEARAAAAGEDGGAVLPTQRHGLDHVFHGSRDDHADRDLPVTGGVGRIQGAGSGIEAHLALDAGRQFRFEGAGCLR